MAVVTAAVAGSSGSTRGAGAPRDQDWLDFQYRFIEPDGRVVDTGNGGVSHSEGQGWALLFASTFGDRATFDRVFDWTQRILRRRTDALFSWRYQPHSEPSVDDPNNATDGDLYIAWALVRAGERWGNTFYKEAGAAIARSILSLLLREVAGHRVLVPGAQGFETPEEVVLNPSYLVFPAYAALARAAPDPRWASLSADGLSILRSARFGRWGLPPDWLAIRRPSGPFSLPPRWPPRFSFDAVRVPLLLVWGGHGREPVVKAAHAFWGDPARAEPPAWADLHNDTVAGFSAAGGTRAIASLVAATLGPRDFVALPAVQGAPDYYAAALILLTRLACHDLGLATRTTRA